MFLVASVSGTATSASSVTAGYRLSVIVLLAPYFYFFFLRALDAPLAHLSVILDLRFRELSVFPEDDVEAHSEYAKCYKDEGC